MGAGQLLLVLGFWGIAAEGHLSVVCTSSSPSEPGTFTLWLASYHVPPTRGGRTPGTLFIKGSSGTVTATPFTSLCSAAKPGPEITTVMSVPNDVLEGHLKHYCTGTKDKDGRQALPADSVVTCYNRDKNAAKETVALGRQGRQSVNTCFLQSGEAIRTWYMAVVPGALDGSGSYETWTSGTDKRLNPGTPNHYPLPCSMSPSRHWFFEVSVITSAKQCRTPPPARLLANTVPESSRYCDGSKSPIPAGSLCHAQCKPGYQKTGRLACTPEGTWDSTFSCTSEKLCGLPTPSNTVGISNDVTGVASPCYHAAVVGKECHYMCGAYGHSVSPGTMKCKDDGKWHPGTNYLGCTWSTPSPTAVVPLTFVPTPIPTSQVPPTPAPTTQAPPTPVPTTQAPPTPAPTTQAPPTPAPTTQAPPTSAPTTQAPPTPAPTTQAPPTSAPTTQVPPTPVPTTQAPPTPAPTTQAPPTSAPTTQVPPTPVPTTQAPLTPIPTTQAPPTPVPTTLAPPTPAPTTQAPPTSAPTTQVPPTPVPTTQAPLTPVPTRAPPIPAPTTQAPPTPVPTTQAPPTPAPTTQATPALATQTPPTPVPTTQAPPTPASTTQAPLTPVVNDCPPPTIDAHAQSWTGLWWLCALLGLLAGWCCCGVAGLLFMKSKRDEEAKTRDQTLLIRSCTVAGEDEEMTYSSVPPSVLDASFSTSSPNASMVMPAKSVSDAARPASISPPRRVRPLPTACSNIIV